MQKATLLAVLCTIGLVFAVGVHDCAPTKKPKAPATTTATTATTSSAGTVIIQTASPSLLPGQTLSTIRPGGRTAWKTKLDPKSKKLFNDYKKVVAKKLQATHKVPATFKPKPAKSATQVVSGILYHYLVKLPTKKYAYVTIHDRQWKKEEYGQEQHVTVRPDLYALTDKNI